MEKLKGKKIEKSPLTGLTRVGDIIHFEGPLLSLYADKSQSKLYLCDWVDRDEKNNRWLFYHVPVEAVFQFIHRAISHGDLFNAAKGKFWTFDISNDLKQHNFYELSSKKYLPATYLPQPDSFFEKGDSPDFRKIYVYIQRALINKLGRRMAHGNFTLDELENFPEQPDIQDLLVSSEIDDAGNIIYSVRSVRHAEQKSPIASRAKVASATRSGK
jgi:hypothetical protein